MTPSLIFDLDGVLVDTIERHYRAWAALANQHNIAFTRADMDDFRGVHRNTCVKNLFAPRDLTTAQIEAYSIIKNHHYLQSIQKAAPGELRLPGALEMLENTQKLGLKVGIASSSTNAVTVIERAELAPYVEVIADGNAVVRGKPKPDIFVWVAGVLRAHPRDCIVFEDSVAGVQAAKTAGIPVVGIGDAERLADADVIYPRLADITLKTLFKQLSGS